MRHEGHAKARRSCVGQMIRSTRKLNLIEGFSSSVLPIASCAMVQVTSIRLNMDMMTSR